MKRKAKEILSERSEINTNESVKLIAENYSRQERERERETGNN